MNEHIASHMGTPSARMVRIRHRWCGYAADVIDRRHVLETFRDRLDNGRKVAIQILEFFDRHGFTIRRQDLRRINPARIEFFAPKVAQAASGGVPLPVGRPDFKSGWGRQTVSGGFDSHPPPPSLPELPQ